MDKALPSNIEAEQAVLGCIINNSDKLLDIELVLAADDFYVDKHKKIFKTISSLYNRKIGVDILTLIEEMRSKSLLDKCGGVTYVSELAGSYFESANVLTYADIVKKKANRRRLIITAQNMLESAYDDDVRSVIDKTENSLYEISSSQSKSNLVTIDDAVEKSLLNLEKKLANGGRLVEISTGFSDIDKITYGLTRKDFVIIAGRPSMGKTAFALNIGQAASKTASVAVFSLEMSNEQLTDRLLSAKCLVDYSKIKSGRLNDKEFEKISFGANELMTRKLVLDDKTTLLGDIKAKCRKLKIQNSLDVVIIDYLQLIRTNLNTSNREQEVSYISRELKALAKELNITVMALSQLSRAPEIRTDHRPILSDLRESGSIEQDADVIHFLYRDEYYNKETEEKNIAEVITAKNRNGKTTTTKLVWLGEFQRFGCLDVIRN